MVNEIKPSVERVVAKSAEKKAWRKPVVAAVNLQATGAKLNLGGDGGGQTS